MGQQSALDELAVRLRALAETVNDLRLTAAEDRPEETDELILDRVATAVTDRAGWVAEAYAAAADARDALRLRRDRAAALCRLTGCHRSLQRLTADGWTGLLPYETHHELARLARARGGEWEGWLRTLRLGVEACRDPLAAVQVALLDAWWQAAAGSTDGGPVRHPPGDDDSTWRCFP